jgi:hypothetical protein
MNNATNERKINMKSTLEKEIVQAFPQYYVNVEEFGEASNDHGNEYYFTICFEMMDDSCFYDKGYEYYQKFIKDGITKILDEPVFSMGDYASTLECVKYGNDTMIALITICK